MHLKSSKETTDVSGRILSSGLVWVIAFLLFVSAVMILASVICLFLPGRMDYIRAAIFSHGIYGKDTINTYLVLHIAARLVLLAVSGVFSFGMLYTLMASKLRPQEPVREAGFSAMIKLESCIHKLVNPLGAVLALLFTYKMICYCVLCYRKRYVNSMIFSFFATVFGELLLGLIAVGVLYWIYRFSASTVDDLTSIQYSLVTQKSSAYGISTSSFFSLCACAVIALSLAFATSYDLFAFAAFAASSIAQLLAAVFMKRTKSFFEELAYEEYIKNGRSSGRLEEIA